MIDWEQGLATVQGDRELLLELLEAMLTEAPQLKADARAAASKDDLKELGRAAHTLKSALRYVGATTLGEEAAEIEKTAKAGELEQSKKLLVPLEDGIERLLPEITSLLAEARKTGP